MKVKLHFFYHIGSFSGMDTDNLRLHQSIITNHPDIVKSYVEFNDSDSLAPLILDYAVSTNTVVPLSNALNAVVTYKTRYKKSDDAPATLSFGLGKSV